MWINKKIDRNELESKKKQVQILKAVDFYWNCRLFNIELFRFWFAIIIRTLLLNQVRDCHNKQALCQDQFYLPPQGNSNLNFCNFYTNPVKYWFHSETLNFHSNISVSNLYLMFQIQTWIFIENNHSFTNLCISYHAYSQFSTLPDMSNSRSPGRTRLISFRSIHQIVATCVSERDRDKRTKWHVGETLKGPTNG